MTKEECAAAVTDKKIKELDFLSIEFLEAMKASGLYLCYTYDDDNFKVIGAENTIVRFHFDHSSEFDIAVFRDTDTGKVRFDQLGMAVAFPDGNHKRPEVELPITLNGVGRPGGFTFTFESPIPAVPVTVHGDNLICHGFVFSDSDIK